MTKPLQDAISFYSHEIDFVLEDIPSVTTWLDSVATDLGNTIHSLQYTFCTDLTIREVNRSFLQHDYPTDIITFPYQYTPVEADIYISIDTVRKNANRFEESFERELLRVMVHGLLHMLGLDDKTSEGKSDMKLAEDKYLALYFNVAQP